MEAVESIRENGIRRWLTRRVVAYLTRALPSYERRIHNDLSAMKRHMRQGDVVLSQGNQRVSAVIRYLTQSPWSHVSLYVGDAILQRGGPLADRAREEFGDEAAHLLVEALPGGVMLTALASYESLNVRCCRPHRLAPEDSKALIGHAIDSIGIRYDLRHLMEIALHFLPAQLLPSRLRPNPSRGRRPDQVICTRLTGELFARVGFPVVPCANGEEASPPPRRPRSRFRRWLRRDTDRYPGVFRQRDPALLAPADFDQSPYFEVVKFNVIADGDFDYQCIHWAEEDPVTSEL